MSDLDRYIQAATAENTRKGYRQDIHHFEEWGGLLPCSGKTICQYLVDHAETLAMSTLNRRLSALGKWHRQQGFVDPTRNEQVKTVFRGIKKIHNRPVIGAQPVTVDAIEQVASSINSKLVRLARPDFFEERPADNALSLNRNKALILVGFWRAFRASDLTAMKIENLQFDVNGVEIYLHRTKGDRKGKGKSFYLNRLKGDCPVNALETWIGMAGIIEGAVFRKIDRWGNLSEQGLNEGSLVALVRHIFKSADVESTDQISSHSLRKGFATWYGRRYKDVKGLMDYVGWKDIQTAVKYVHTSSHAARLPGIDKL